MSAIVSPFPSFSLPVSSEPPGLFYAGAENGGLAEFYSYSGNITVETAAKKHGDNGYKVSWSGSLANGWGRFLFDPVREADIAMRTYFYIPSGFNWGVSIQFGTILELLSDVYGTRAAVLIRTDGDGVPIGWRVYSNADYADYSTGFALDTWICIELLWKYGSPDSVEFYVNNSLAVTVSGNSSANRNVQWGFFGCRSEYTFPNGAYLYFDSCKLDSAYIGLYPG